MAALAASDSTLFSRSAFIGGSNHSFILRRSPLLKLSPKLPAKKLRCCSCCTPPYNSRLLLFNSNKGNPFTLLSVKTGCCANEDANCPAARAVDFGEVLVRRGLAIAAAAAIGAVAILSCRRALAVEGLVGAGYGFWERSSLAMRSSWPKVLQVLTVFKEQGLVLAALLGLSAFFSMAETSITTLWPWKVRELAEKESEDGVFKLLRNDVTRFLTTILIGTTYFMCPEW